MVVDIFNTDRKYQTIYADPPWWETGGGKIKRGADRHYQLMKTPEIIALPVPELIAPDGCHLYLWATNNHLKDAFAVMEARREHSQKPERMRQMIETVSYGPMIELFAREQRNGWDAWDLEVQEEGNSITSRPGKRIEKE